MLDSTLSYSILDSKNPVDYIPCSPAEELNDLEQLRVRSSTKTIIVPKVQSMQDYILKHHKRLILAELNRQLKEGTLRYLVDSSIVSIPLRVSDCTFEDMAFWRCDTYTLLVDVVVSIPVDPVGSADPVGIYCELWVDMRSGMNFWCGESGLIEDQPVRDYWMLSRYLVPVLRKEDVERGAEELLLRYCPDALKNPEEHNAYILANRMGLSVERYPLYRQSNTLSTLYFSSGKVLVDAEDESGSKELPPREVTIPAGTILINTNAVHKDYCQLEIYHECIHYDWHFMFCRLQDMHNSDIKTLRTRRVVITSDKTPSNPLKWMEWQARRGSFGLMMPLGMMRPLIKQLSDSGLFGSVHAGKRYDRIARSISRDYDLPKFRVRARLIQMGYIAAKGALNYVDGRYIEPFAFALHNGDGDYSFVIDRKNVYDIYKEDETFREQINSGRYVYVDGHVVLNDDRFFQHTAMGTRLTAWANAHVDECCLRFINVYEQMGAADYCFGAMNSDEEYNRHYFAFAENKGKQHSNNSFAAMTQILEAMPASFSGALKYLMQQTRTTIEQLEEYSHISSRTISRLRTEEGRECSLDQVIAICVALHLPPWLSRGLLQRAGYTLRTTKQHQAFQFVLDCLFMDSIDDVQAFLKSSGCHPLKLPSEEV